MSHCSRYESSDLDSWTTELMAVSLTSFSSMMMLYLILLCSLVVLVTSAVEETCSATTTTATRLKVVVSGAGGQTGQALFRKMLELPDEFEPVGLVRTAESKNALVESGIPESSIAIVDVRNAAHVKKVASGCAAFMICTSAKPKPTTTEVNPDTGRPVFGFPDGSPEEVDWIGQKNQIDACGPDAHIVLCSTMGGSDPNHMLNKMGRKTNPDGTVTGGNIVKWKRKAEAYLMASGKPYTIVHPGGLINGAGGERELVLGVDDEQTGTESRTVPRQDVAQVMLEALRHSEYRGRSFDLRAKPVGDGGGPTSDFAQLLETLKGRNCDYSLGEIM